MAYVTLDQTNAGFDASGRLRVSQLRTLFDGKTLNADDTDLWGVAGSGTNTFANSSNKMIVTSGQYLIRYSKFFHPYFSGKSQFIELTFDNFQTETGLIKRVGYFSSNAVAPYDSNKDGFWLESNGDDNTISIQMQNNGTTTLYKNLKDIVGYENIANYDWSNFTVINFDFLWLGGANWRLFLVLNTGFALTQDFVFAGSSPGTMIKSPNQTLRYEIRSTTGAGYLTAICSQVATEGIGEEGGKVVGLFSNVGISCNAVGTIYAIKSWRKQANFRDTVVEILDMGITRTATADAGILLLIKNPTLSAPIAYVNTSRIQEGTPTNQTITAGTGRILHAVPASESGVNHSLSESFLSYLTIDITNTPDEFVLAYMPTTINQTVYATVNLKEY